MVPWIIVIAIAAVAVYMFIQGSKDEEKEDIPGEQPGDSKPFKLGRLYKVYTPGTQKIQKKTNCAKCGAPIEFDYEHPSTSCKYCGCFVPEFQDIISNAKYHIMREA